MAKKKPPTSADEFIAKTGLDLRIVAETVLDQVRRRVGEGDADDSQIAYFVEHCDVWIRWFFANDDIWRASLLSKRNGGKAPRDWCYTWIEHWAEAFLKNPAAYIDKHPMKTIAGDA